MQLTEQEKKELYGGIMKEIYESVAGKLNETNDQQKRLQKGYAKGFLGHQDMIALIYANDKKTVADAFVYQRIEKDEYDVYLFRINLQNGRLQPHPIKIDDKVKQSLERHLNATTHIECNVRDAYSDIKDIKSIFTVLADDPREILEAFYDIVGFEPQRSTDEHPYKQKYVYKRKDGSNEAVLAEQKPAEEKKDDNKKPSIERDKDGKLTGKAAKYATEISNMLKEISKDDRTFYEIVRLFGVIKRQKRRDGNYAQALAAVNDQLIKDIEK